jgi:hypothetical protein
LGRPFFFWRTGRRDGANSKFEAEKMSTLESKTRRRSGGPRTAHGKSKSSQNSRKHLIFIDRVLPEEEAAAALLGAEIRAELRLEGPMELSIGRELVKTELQARRIDRFAVQEWTKARMLALINDADDQCHAFRLPIPKQHETEPGYCPRMRPQFCAVFLKYLKRLVESHGPRPDEDLAFLEWIYGNQLTIFAQAIVFHFQILQTCQHFDKAHANPKMRDTEDQKARILEAIESEINQQEIRQKLERVPELFEPTSDSVVLPPSDIADRIERYDTMRLRKVGRCLGILGALRGLKE